ncbi:MAG TPA: Ig-like domain-containing protein [Verrucomicrobiota bacterium]|nr:hypothetical protein [Verrucomicrobiales bacterium]HRI11404.1 Ig-like domain-containing protein [Verrucomicrobiota bacterium]
MSILVSPSRISVPGSCASRLLIVIVGSLLLVPSLLGQAPVIVSRSPADGATDVTAPTPLILVFDRDMDTLIPPSGALGTIVMDPANLNAQTIGTWGTDKRTLTIKPGGGFGVWPINVAITWKLNPPGLNPFFQIKSAAGVALESVSGNFTTGLGAPALGSVSPTNGATSISPATDLIFRFTQQMKQIALPGGPNPAITVTGPGLDPSKLSYQWAGDGRSLTVGYNGDFPVLTRIDWVLNPVNASIKFESVAGKPLPAGAYEGSFTTAESAPCNQSPLPAHWGSYGLAKRSNYVQTSAAPPVEETGDTAAFLFSAVIMGPAFGPAVTAGSLEFPDGTSTNLTSNFYLQYYDIFDTAAELEAAHPPGPHTLRFTQTGQPERVIPMNVTADAPPVPRVTNFEAAQAITATQDFTLQWEPFANAAGNDFMSMYISDDHSIPFQAPNLCIPRPLPVTSTSIVVPANTLVAERSYTAEILFGKAFYFSTNTVTDMYGYGYVYRATRFTVKTRGGVAPKPATLSAARLLSDGRGTFDLTGDAGQTYGIQKAETVDATTWAEVGTVVPNGSGLATYQETGAPGSAPRFYRAVPK